MPDKGREDGRVFPEPSWVTSSPVYRSGVSNTSRCLQSVPHILTSLSRITPDALSEKKTHLPWCVLIKLYEETSTIKWEPLPGESQSCMTLNDSVSLKGSSVHILTVHLAGPIQAFRLTQLWLLLCPLDSRSLTSSYSWRLILKMQNWANLLRPNCLGKDIGDRYTEPEFSP